MAETTPVASVGWARAGGEETGPGEIEEWMSGQVSTAVFLIGRDHTARSGVSESSRGGQFSRMFVIAREGGSARQMLVHDCGRTKC
jgi:hypothetical protein